MKAFLLLPVLASSAAAWGVVGHEIVATIAQMLLTEKTKQEVAQILPEWTGGHLGPVAAWADKIKSNPWWRSWSSSLHFVNPLGDWPSTHCEFGQSGWHSPERNLFLAISNYTRRVEVVRGEEQDFALRFLVHYIGDLHQPLHLTGRERGGNNLKVHWEGRVSSLHSVWDGGFITKAVREMNNYTQPLNDKRIEGALRGTIYDPYIRWIVKEGLLGWWKEEYLSWARCPDEEESLEALLAASSSQVVMGGTSASVATSLPDDPDLPSCPHHWGSLLHPLNCEIIFPPVLDAPNPDEGQDKSITALLSKAFGPLFHPRPHYPELNIPSYAGKIRDQKLVEKLLAMGGVRLAAVLNDIFDPPRVPGQRSVLSDLD